MSIVLPANYALVGVGMSSLLVLNIYQIIAVSNARKASKVEYPNLYASDAEAKADPKKHEFNCVQRAHQNTLENATYIVPLTLFLGVFHPKLATAFSTVWSFGRIFYTTGYSTGVPSKRNNAIARIQYIGLFGLFFSTFYVAAQGALAAL